MAAFAADVAIDETGNSSGSGDLTISPLDPDDGNGLIVVAAVNGSDGSRNVVSVKLHSSTSFTAPDLDFIEIGRIDGDDDGANDQNHLLTFWKLDNRAFEGEAEDDYDQVLIDFAGGATATYGFAYVVSGQMGDDMVRNWEELAINSSTDPHSITDFVLEADAMIISAHFWNASASVSASLSDTPDWNPHTGTTGLAIQHSIPKDAANETLTATFSGGVGFPTVDTLNAAVVIRSNDDIIHTPTGAPATLGDGTSGGYWLEGLTAQEGASGSVGDRGDITDFGVTHTGKATWLNTDICDGKASSAYRKITYLASPGTNEINIMAFSPLNANREAEFDMYLAGLESELADAIGSEGYHRHLGTGGNDWGDYTGLVVWDLERFCLHYDGAPGGSSDPDWGGQDVYNVSNDDEWEYNAATRYYWERIHQWFVAIKAPSVEALVFYHHPQQPTKIGGLSTDWWGDGQMIPYDHAGYDWQREIEWVYKMQGAFDGHCYPPSSLTDAQIDDWVTNVLENFRVINGQLSLYCYVTHWPSRPGIEAYQDSTAVTAIIDTDDAIRTRLMNPYTNFDAMYLGVVGLGTLWGETFTITSVNALASTVTISGEHANQFDPADPTVQISGSHSNDGTYNFDRAELDGLGNTIVYLDEPPLTLNNNTPRGNLITPAKTITDFVNWWVNIFVAAWDIKF